MTLDHLPVGKKIILFDGICNLCTTSVQFLIQRDKQDLYRFVPLQSDLGKDLLTVLDSKGETIDSVVLFVPPKTFYLKSEAAVEILVGLGGLYTLARIFSFLPKRFSNAIYGYIARNRYRWYGQRATCMVPSPDLLSKFLS